MTDTPRSPPSEEDDEGWFEALAGRPAPDARAATLREAAWLRAALLSYRQTPPAGLMPNASGRIDRLLAKAIAAGLITAVAPPPSTPAASPLLRSWASLKRLLSAWPAPALALATVGALAVLVWPRLIAMDPTDTSPMAEVSRSSDTHQVVQAAQPQATRDQLMREFSSVGLAPRAFSRLGRWGLSIEWPSQATREQLEVLQRHGLRAPNGPLLVVEVQQESRP
jgi:hypothetical protein